MCGLKRCGTAIPTNRNEHEAFCWSWQTTTNDQRVKPPMRATTGFSQYQVPSPSKGVPEMTKSPMDHRRRELHYMLHSADNTTTQIHVNKLSTHETQIEKLTSGDKPFHWTMAGVRAHHHVYLQNWKKGKLISWGVGGGGVMRVKTI